MRIKTVMNHNQENDQKNRPHDLISEIGGGKFANGAITGAFSIMFNDMMHYVQSYRKKIRKIYKSYQVVKDNYPSSKSFYKDYLGGEIGDFAEASPLVFQNTCAARLSDALNQNDISIPHIKGQTYRDKNGNNVFIRAIDMKNYLKTIWGEPKIAKTSWKILNAIVYQNGFGRGVSGHVDVFSRGISGGAGYMYHKSEEILTYYW